MKTAWFKLHFWARLVVLLALWPSTGSPAGFVVNNGAPQTGAVIGRSSGSLDTVVASGAFAGSYSHNSANGGATEFVTIQSNAVITLPSPKLDGSAATISGGYGSTYTWGGGGFSGNTGNTIFNALLNDFYFDGGNHFITLRNLIPGQSYSAQLFALDDRAGSTARLSSFQDPNNTNDVSATFAMGDNVYVVGTFTATGTNMTIQQNLFTTPLSPPSGPATGSSNGLLLKTNFLAAFARPQARRERGLG